MLKGRKEEMMKGSREGKIKVGLIMNMLFTAASIFSCR